MLPPPPASRNSSYAYRPDPSPSIEGAWDHANAGEGSTSYSKAGGRPASHIHQAKDSGSASLRTPSHVRWPSHASAKSGIPGGYGEMHGSSRVMDDDEEDSDVARHRETSSEHDMDELRAEMMGADDARRAGRSRGLEETLEELGFGAYHWRLLALCGFGWMSDNSALQCIAVILPRVQVHFNLSSEAAGLLSSATMAGMMVGAIGWGVLSDMLGRSLPFNSTLFLTAVFGIGASFAPNFPVLLGWMFMLGSAVGGSMPTDGTLFLENLPHSKQYLLTLLSVFFSLGAVLSSVVSYFLLPGHSCQAFEGCDIAGGANEGWRSVLFVLGLFNLACAFARWFLFRLKESPRYLVTNGREQEAVVALQAIATYNDTGMDITRADVMLNSPTTTMRDIEHCHQVGVDDQYPHYPTASGGTFDSERASLPRYEHGALDASAPDSPESPPNSNGRPGSRTRYDAVGLGPAPPPRDKPIRAGSEFYTPMPTRDASVAYPDGPETGTGGSENRFEASFSHAVRGAGTTAAEGNEEDGHNEESERLMGGGHVSRLDAAPTDTEKRSASTSGRKSAGGPLGAIQSWLRGWSVQMGKLFAPRWRRTVILMWIIWGAMAFAYTMFNVWLPAVLESRSEGEGDEAIKSALTKFVLYSGCPGSIMGAYMIQTSLGRRKSLAICTLATGISTFIFIRVKSDTAVVVSSMFISTAATAMYAVLYGMTPETFGTAIRGTACGTSAALSRLTGVMAPVSAGFLLSISPSSPVFTSAAIFVLTAGCSLLLPFERVAEGGAGGGFMH